MNTIRLVIEGLNRYVRHPLYAGTILIVLGLVVFLPTMTNLIVFILILIYTLIGIKLEEKKLVEQFGQEYEDYRKNVPMLIPKIFKR
jgi:protein-S-isoprenylcysteine O-methyltransferase Ste14